MIAAQQDPERWRRISAILDEVLDLPATERGAFLDRACGDDATLRTDVEALLAADAKAASFLDTSAAGEMCALVDDAAPAEDSAEPAGTRVGPYRIVREIGRGGMGIVFLAERADGQFDQRVALKVIKRGMDTDEVLRRFLAERQILARLHHPNIAKLFDGGMTEDGRPFFAMEHVEGTPLPAYCKERDLSLAARLALVRDVCEAVQYAHRNLIVHRDLKPSNILVTADGDVKLLDFGIAKLLGSDDASILTVTGERVMTPFYAAPEQLRGEPVTTATDVFALGLLLYEVVTGERPPRDRDPRLGQGDLDSILAMAIREEPERRYHSAEALGEDLNRFIEGLPVVARKGTLAYRTRKFVLRHRVGVTAAVIGVAGLLAGLAGTLWQARVAVREAEKTKAVKDFLVSVFEVSDPDESKGEQITARELLDRSSGRIEAELSRQPEVAAELLGVVGGLYHRLGMYDRAAPLLERDLVLRRRLYGEGALPVAESLARLADLRLVMGEFEEAERLLRDAGAIHRRGLGPDHPATVSDTDALARVLIERGGFDEASRLVEGALASLRRTGGEVSEAYATALTTQEMLFVAKGDYVRAEPPMRRALDIRLKLLGERHTLVAECYNNLGFLAQSRGNFAEAEGMYRRSMAIATSLYGSDHPDLWTDLNNLAKAVQEQGRLEEAETLQRRSLALRQKQLGADNPQLAVNYHNLALLLRERGQYEEAVTLLRKTVALNRQAFGDDHPSQAITFGSLALVLSESGNTKEAETLFRRSLEIFKSKGLEQHTKLPDVLEGLGLLLVDSGRAPEAEPLLRQSLSLRLAAYGDGAWRTASAKLSLARCLLALGRKTEAKSLAEAALPVLRRTRGEDHALTRQARAILGALR